MMSADSQLMHLSTWEGFSPHRARQARNTARLSAGTRRKGLRRHSRMYPGAFNAHPMHLDWAEEEMLLLNHSFCSFSILALPRAELLPVVSAGRQNRRLPLHRRPDAADRLAARRAGRQAVGAENPQHMMDLNTLLRCPSMRDWCSPIAIRKTVASVMSLMWHYTVQHTDAPCRASVREIWLDFCQQAARRCMTMREQIPAAQQIDVYYEQINHDWRQRRNAADLMSLRHPVRPAGAAGAGRLAAGERKRNLHGGHKYALENFGTSKDEVEQRMKFVRDFYAIPF